MPIEVKKAVQLARGYLSDILQIDPMQVLLEEVELSDDHQFWLVTLSYPGPEGSTIQIFTGRAGRAYKVVKLDADTGQMVSIKIRSLAAV